METNKIYNENCIETMKRMPGNFIDCVVTSPPYWGLRDYGHEDQIGLEATPEEYVSKMVEIFREVRRVLRPEGTLWLNLGDSYAAYWGDKYGKAQSFGQTRKNIGNAPPCKKSPDFKTSIFKPKDLIGIPWMVAFALRSDGWWLRQDIIWAKPNPMPESVTDRCTKAHEYIFLLTKSERYFYDADAIAEKTNSIGCPRPFGGAGNGKQNKDRSDYFYNGDNGKRNKRSIWEITTRPLPETHFATFPIELPSLCILAGTSEKGYCPGCGKPRERILEKTKSTFKTRAPGASVIDSVYGKVGNTSVLKTGEIAVKATIGWRPTCNCKEADLLPGIVYDPFMGAGTTALAALKYGRQFIGSEINPEYCKIGNKRIAPYLKQMRLAI